MKDAEFNQCLEAILKGSTAAYSKLYDYLTRSLTGEAQAKQAEHRKEIYTYFQDKAKTGLFKKGNPWAQALVGVCYSEGFGVLKNDNEAVKWYRLSAEQGNCIGENGLGWMYAYGRGVPKDDKEAVKWYRRAAEQNLALAQNNLGWMYQNGRGVPKDDKEAVKWYRRAAEQNLALAQYNLWWMYANGRGVPKDDSEAVKWYRLAAEQNDSDAQFVLGVMYANGRGVPKDDSEAVKWFRKAAEQNKASAQHNLGVMYENGRGVPKDDSEAVKWFRLAAEQNDSDAQFVLGVMYANGRGVPQSDVEAVKWYLLAAEQNLAQAQFNLGVMYQNSRGVPQSDADAVKWYRKAAEQNYASAQFALGWMYRNGRGVPQSDADAVKWYRKAAEQNDNDAQFALGVMYANGRGVPQSDAEAVKWYRKAAEQNLAAAQNNLGVMYENGRGVPQSDAEAVKWYRKAAEQDHPDAQNNLGWMYEDGRGVPQSDAEAVKWYRKAAEQNLARAQTNLGVMYENGRGIAQSIETAIEWYVRAEQQGHERAKNNLADLSQKGYSKQIEKARQALQTKKIAKAASSPTSLTPKPDEVTPQGNNSLPTPKAQPEEAIKPSAQAVNSFQPEKKGPFNVTIGKQSKEPLDAPVKEVKPNTLETPSPQPVLSPTTVSVSQPASLANALPTPEKPTSLPTLTWQNLHMGELLGNGGFGDVYKGTYYGKLVAIKQLHLKKLTADLEKDFLAEGQLLWQCQHGNIIALHGICLEIGHYALVMEYMPKGSLYQVLQDKVQDLPWQPLRYQLALDIAQGLRYLHDQKIIHRDLKSLNVLVDNVYHAKISDFGLAKIKKETSSTSTASTGNKLAGSIRWQAPELFKRGAQPTYASDVYSYGMILWEIASRTLPFNDAPNEITVGIWLKDGEQETIPTDCPEDYAKVIQHCWAKDPTTRPHATDIVKQLQPASPKTTPTVDSRVSAPGKLNVDVRVDYQDLAYVKVEGKPFPYVLGKGAFGKVYLGSYHGSLVAIKELNDVDETKLDELYNEVSIMKSVNSPRAVHCYGMTIAPYTLVMDYMPNGTLYAALQEPTIQIKWAYAYQVCLDISYGLEYLHKKDIVHGDLKSGNVLLDKEWRAKIADFGSSRVRVTTKEGNSIHAYGQKAGGTPNYLAPELWQELHIQAILDPQSPTGKREVFCFSEKAKTTKASDVYSLGLLFWETTTRRQPFIQYFSGASRVPYSQFKALLVDKGLQETPNPKTPPRLKELMQHCWFKAPEKRPAITQVLNEIKTEANSLPAELANTLIPKLTA